MKTAVLYLLLVSLLFVAPVARTSPGYTVDSNQDGKPDQWYEVSDGRVDRVSMDRNFDSQIDYNVKYDLNHRKVYEEMDFNFDGVMDDCYFFSEGKLVRQEIDTNYDGRVDVWVYLDGLYVLRYEMDSDFDGKVDVVKDCNK